jgi:hypothetical protein
MADVLGALLLKISNAKFLFESVNYSVIFSVKKHPGPNNAGIKTCLKKPITSKTFRKPRVLEFILVDFFLLYLRN